MVDPPRTVRCARCAHDWMAVAVMVAEPVLPEEPAAAPGELAEPEVPLVVARESPVPEPAALAVRAPVARPEAVFGDTPLSAIERLAVPGELSPQIRRRDRLLTTAWALSFAALAALGVAGYTERDALMRQWPASKRVYATLGLAQFDGKADDGKVSAGQGGAVMPNR